MRLTPPCFSSVTPRLVAALFVALGLASAASAQQAPQVLPFTMSTFAGPHAAYTAYAACGNGIGIALDTQGDGCLANSVSVGTDPHDVRVDARGNVFFIDNASAGLVHKINGQTGQETIYIGSPTSSKVCTSATDTAGDGCPANDGAANNSTSNVYTSNKFTTQRGLGLAPNGDLYVGGYKDFYIHKVSVATGLMTVVAGTGSAGTVANAGTATATAIASSRGVGADASGNFYIAETGLNVIQFVNASTGQMSLYTAANAAGTKNTANGPVSAAIVDAPEDVQVDVNGNVIIDDQGNSVVRAVYNGKGPFFGISSPTVGWIYTIAGNGGSTTTYTQGGSVISTAVPGTTIPISSRKLSSDSQGNVYIADTTNGYVWFLDAQTGYIRLLVGNFGVTGGVAQGCDTTYNSFRVTDTVGDLCPGIKSELYGNSNVSIGVSADNQGNIYISDPENGIAASSRIRKVLSGLNFYAAVASGSTALQTVDIHFGPADSFGSVTLATGDFTAGTQTCVTNADTTSDCTLPITFKPTKAGYETANLIVTSTLGGKSSFTVTGTGTVSTVAIDPGTLTAVTTNTNAPQAVAYDGNGNTYVADTSNNKVLKVTSAGIVSTFAGTGTAGNSGDTGLATAATLNAPAGLAFGENAGVLFIADTGNNTIRQVNLQSGIITTIAGGASSVCSTASNTRGDNCPATQATFSKPRGLAVDKVGVLYVADSSNNVIRTVSTNGYIYTFAGGASAVCSTATDTQGDGCAANAVIFSNPTSLAYDLAGNYLLVADTSNNIARKIYLANIFTVTSSIASAVINPLTLVAGNGQAGSTVSSSGLATQSQLNLPTGIAVDAAENVYLADTGNHAIRLVNSSGIITTITGIVGTSGASTPGVATDTLINSPSAVAVLPSGQLYIADAGNNRVLSDVRAAVAYNFGRVSPGVASSTETFTPISIGNASTTFGSSVVSFTSGNGQADFTLAPSTTGGCVASSAFAPGASCSLTAGFTPATVAVYTANYTVNAAQVPTIALSGTGAILTTTTPVLTQTAPTTGNAQYGGSLTLSVTVTPATCNTAAPSCYPTGTVRFVIDGTSGSPVTVNATAMASQTFTGLAVGPHTVSCTYSGDVYYAASSCANTTITIAAATTTSVLTESASTATQFAPVTLTATIKSSTIGIPTGTVTFYDTPTGSTTPVVIGTGNVNATTGVATFTMSQTLDGNGLQTANTTLVPGTYSLTCTYNPTGGTSANFATSNCPGISFTVTANAASMSIVTRGCSAAVLGGPSNVTPLQGSPYCTTEKFISGVVTVSTAQGSTTDATMFITPTDTVVGPLTFSCSGLPTYGRCTFSPSSYPLAAGTGYVAPIPVDITLWTDVKDAALTMPSIRNQQNGTVLASLTPRFGWPIALLGFAGLFAARRRFRNLRVLGVALLLAGSSMVITGCAGPGNYTDNLTPAGTYPVSVTVKSSNGATATTVVNFVVTAPGLTGLE